MSYKPPEFVFHLTVTPLVQLYDADLKLQRFVRNWEELGLWERAKDTKDLVRLVDAELKLMGLGTPVRAVFVDGTDGVETEYPEFVSHPVLVITLHDAKNRILPLVH